MSGIIIDVDTKAESAKRDLNELNRNLAALVKNSTASNSSLNKISTQSFKNISKDLDSSVKKFSTFRDSGTKSLTTVDSSAQSLSNTINSLKSGVVALGTAFLALRGINYFNKVSDDLVKVQNRLRLSTDSAEELLKTQTKIYQVAKDARATFADTANIYVDFTKALERTNFSQQRILNVTKTIQQAAALSGSSAEATRGALIQLTQGIASGTLRGEELNSVMEQMKYLGQGIQTVLGKNAGSLRKFAEEGNLTTEVLLNVLETLGDKTQKDFEKTAFTVEAATGRMKQSIDFFFADINQYFGSSERLAKILVGISSEIDSFSVRLRGTFTTLRRSLYNYVAQFDIFDALELTIKGMLRFEISPIDAYSKYNAYKEIKRKIADFKKGDLDKDSLTEDLAIALDIFRIDTSGSSGKAERLTESLKQASDTIILTTKRLLATLVTTLKANPFTDFFVVTVENWLSLVPILRGPIQTVASSIRQIVRGLFVDINAYLYDTIIPTARVLEATAEYITGFIVGDNRIERAWVNLFKASSIVEFTDKLRELNKVRRDIKYDDLNFVFREVGRVFRGVGFYVQDALVALNLMDNTIIKIRDSRLDRVIKYFQTFGTVLLRVYQDVFATTIEPIIFKIGFAILAIFETLTDAIEDTFTKANGERFAKALINSFKAITNFLKNNPFEIFLQFDDNQTKNVIDRLKGSIIAIGEFLLQFFKTLGTEIFDSISNSFVGDFVRSVQKQLEKLLKGLRSKIESLINKIPESFSDLKLSFDIDLKNATIKDAFNAFTKTLLEVYKKSLDVLVKIENRISDFGKKIKKVFFDIYDKVVGNSYWPDTIDGINEYTRDLLSSESLIGKFANKVKALFSDIALHVKEKGTVIGKQFSEIFTNIGNIKVADLANSLYANISSAIVAAIFFLSGNTTLKLLSFTYFANLFNGAIFSALGAIGPGVAQIAGSALGEFSAKLAEGIIRGLDLTLEALPSFVASFVSTLNPLPDVIKEAFSDLYSIISIVMPGIGVLLQNNLIFGLLTAAGLLAVFSSDMRSTLGTLVFGKTNKKGVRTEGIVDYLSAIVSQFVPIASKSVVKVFENPALAIAGAAAFSTALLDSISIFEAAQVGLPLLAFALLGKEGGARLVKDITLVVEKILFTVIKSAVSVADTVLGKGNILSKIINTPFELYEKALSKFQSRSKSTTTSALVTDLKQMFVNLKANTERYAKGELNFWEMLTFKPKDNENIFNNFDPFGPKANTGVVNIGKSLSEFIAPITNIEIAGKRLPDFFKGLYRDISLNIQQIFLAIRSANISGRLLEFGSDFIGGLGDLIRSSTTSIRDALTVLLGFIKNKFVLFSILAAGFSGVAFAASDATAAISVFGKGLTGAVVGIVAIGAALSAVVIALKSISKFKAGKQIFEQFKAGTFQAEDINLKVSKFKESAEFAFEKTRASDLKKFRAVQAAELLKEELSITKKGLDLKSKLNKAYDERDRLRYRPAGIKSQLDRLLKDQQVAQEKLLFQQQEGIKPNLSDTLRNADRLREIKDLQKELASVDRLAAKNEKRVRDLNAAIAANNARAAVFSARKASAPSDEKDFEENRRKRFDKTVEDFRKQEEKNLARSQQIGLASSPLAAGLLNARFYLEDVLDTIGNKSKIPIDKFKASGSGLGKLLTNTFKVSKESVVSFADSFFLLKEGFNVFSGGDFKAGFGLMKDSLPEIGKSFKAIKGDIFKNISDSFATLFPVLAATSGIFNKIKVAAIAVGTAIRSAVITPLLAALTPILVISAKVTAALSVVGLLALHFFGPDDTQFITKLEWVYDKVRSIFGLEATTKGGRLVDILNQFKDIEVAGKKIDFRNIIGDVDFAQMSEKQFSVYKKLSEETKQTFETLNEAAIRQGGKLTEQQKIDLGKAEKEFKDFTLRLPQKANQTLEQGSEELNKQLLNVDNSLWTLVKRMLGWKTAFERIGEDNFSLASLIYKIESYIGDLNLTRIIVDGIGVVLGTIAGGPIGAAIGLAISESLYWLFTGISAGLSWTFGKLSTLVRNATEGWIWAFNNVVEGLTYGIDIAGKKIENFLKRIGVIKEPAPADVARAQDIGQAEQAMFKYQKFLPKDFVEQTRQLQKEFINAQEDFNTILNRDVNPNIEKDLNEYVNNYIKALVKLEKAEAKYKRALESGAFMGQQFFNTAELEKRVKKISEDASTLLNLSFGKDNAELLGSSEVLGEYEFYIERVKQLNNSLTVAQSAEARNRLLIERNSLQKQAENLKERAALFSTEAGFYKGASETVGFSEGFLRNSEAFRADAKYFEKSINEIRRLENKLLTANITQTNPNNLNAWRKELQKLREEVSQRLVGGTWIEDLNEALKKLAGIEIPRAVYRGIPEGVKQALAINLANLNTLDSARKETGISAEERGKRENQFLAAQQGTLNFVRSLRIGAVQSEQSLEGLSVLLGKEIPVAIGRATGKQGAWLRMSKQLQLVEESLLATREEYERTGATGAKENLTRLYSQKFILERGLNKLQETFSLDTLTGALSQVGLSLEGQVFAGLGKAAKRELIDIGIFLTDFKKDLSELDIDAGETLGARFQKQAEKIKRAAEIIFGITKESGKAFVDALTNAGFNSFENATVGVISSVIKLNVEVKKLEFELNNLTFDLDRQDSLGDLLARLRELEKKRKVIREFVEDATQTFATRLSSFNELFKTSLSDLDFASFGVQFGLAAGDLGRTLKRELDNVYAKGKTSFGQAGIDFIQSLENIRRAGEYLTFFTEIRKTLSDSLVEGAKAGFDRIKSVLPDFGFDFKEFRKIAGPERRAFSQQAAQLSLLEKAAELPNLTQPLADILGTFDGTNASQVLEKFQKEFLKTTKRNLEDVLKSPTEINTTALEQNTNALDELTAAFTGKAVKERVKLSPDVTTIGTETLPSPQLAPIAQKAAANVANSFYENIEANRATLGENLLGSQQKQLTRKQFLKPFGIDPRALNLANDAQLKVFETQVKNRQEATKALATANDKERVDLQIAIDSYDKVLSQLSDSILSRGKQVEAAGESFAQSVSDTLTSAISGLLKGEADGEKSVWKTFTERILNNFTSSVIDTFVNGLMDPLTGKDGLITKGAKSLGESIFGSAKESTDKALGIFKPQFKALKPSDVPVETKDLTGAPKPEDVPSGLFKDFSLDKLFGGLKEKLSGLTEGFGGLFKNFKLPDFSSIFGDLFGSLKGGFSSILGLFGFAEGGRVSGPGTGTSDSIPAMLSNGEFVVNAKATRDNLALLTAVNSGKFRKFAEGGLVSTAIVASPVATDIKTAQGSNATSQQIINLTITGDISRQTRAEIYQMLPSIAEGVNMHNKERGYR
jgi:tape measure domain-containing protein